MTQWIIFHTPQPLDTLDSGSSVRPAKMLDAFKGLGYNVDAVVGNANERKQKIKSIKQNDREYLFCYSEPTTWPLNPFVDYRLYWYLQSSNIPIGVFYRDLYWKFPKLFDYSGVKYLELQARYRIDLWLIRTTSKNLYVPSKSFGDLIGKDISTDPLPPGCVDHSTQAKASPTLERIIYVGGLSPRYGSKLLAEIAKVVESNHNIKLDIVCRESEFNALPNEIQQTFRSEGTRVSHVSGQEIIPHYKQADAGIIPFQPTNYNNLAMPVKLFEYLSHGLPIISTDCSEIASFINQHNCGIISSPDKNSMTKAITELTENDQLFQKLQKNAIQASRDNLWISRAKTVANDLQI